MEDNDQKKKMKKPEADFVLPETNLDPHGNLFYDPAIPKGATIGAVAGGIILGLVAWMMADGAWAIEGLGQLGAGNRGSGTFLGFVTGSAIGGLFGSLIGIRKMLQKKK